MKRKRSGMAVLELLVALAVAGLIATAGMRALSSLMVFSHQRNFEVNEALLFASIGNRFQHHWDQRLSHRIQTEDWLILTGMPDGDGIQLEQLRMKTVTAEGAVIWCELIYQSEGWVEVLSGADGGAPIASRYLGYIGAIWVNLPASRWPPGAAPEVFRWQFPDARFRRNQIGFAVVNDRK